MFVLLWHNKIGVYIGIDQQGRQEPGNTKGGSITVLLTSCLTGLDKSVLQIKTKIVSCLTADSKRVKQEVNCTVILSPLVFPDRTNPMLVMSP